jgi:UDP-N-acetylglucosamine 2-epimerase (non-hydrolysing)
MLERLRDHPPSVPWDVSHDFWFTTLHRQELTSNTEKLREILDVLVEAPVEVYLAAHPGLRRAMENLDIPPTGQGALHIVEPLDFPSLVWVLSHCRGVVTDSGGLQKEAYLLKVPCATLRRETEWVETITLGWNRLAWDNPRSLLESYWTTPPEHHEPSLYGDGAAAARALGAMRALQETT